MTANYDAAAAALDNLAELVEDAANDRDLTPAEIARQAGVSVASVLALHDGRDIALRSAAALLRWLGTPPAKPIRHADGCDVGHHNPDANPICAEHLNPARRPA